MRFEAGPLRSVGTDGRHLYTDRVLSATQVDFLNRILDTHNRDADDTSAIEVNEGSVVFEPVAVEEWP